MRRTILLLFWLLAGCHGRADVGPVAGPMSAAQPRSLPPRLAEQWPAVVRNRLLDEVARLPPPDAEPIDDLMAGDPGARARAGLEVQQISFGEAGHVTRLALAALADPHLVRPAKARALHLAAWSPRGTTAFYNHDLAATAIASALALAYDWLAPHWTPEERARLLAAVRPRVEDALAAPNSRTPSGWAALDWGRKLDRWPYDSHGAVVLAQLAVICTLLAPEDAFFARCAEAVLPRYQARPIPWGGRDGGYANGTGYAQWDVAYTHFIVWHLLRQIAGVDLWQSDWARGYINFLAYFQPPGSPSGLFGDGAEQRHPGVWATQAKAYAAALPSPLADWYARNQFGEDPLHPALLLAPPRDWQAISGALPPGTPHAVHLADIGWVAMHSDLGERARTSVYFKSSPYGSYSHSHADQNAFVIHARGRVLAADSGYYDYYGSPHWREWYKQTRAHNAITYDGGQGQLHDTMAAKGRITRFEHHPEYDVVTGDATEAYGGTLTRALRSVVFLRPDTVLVYDSLASATPRTWEWNLHALSRMKERGPRALEIEQDGVRLCVELLQAPEGAFTQTDRFTAEPQGKYPRQWHARFTSDQKSLQSHFLALLDVECRRPKVEFSAHERASMVAVMGFKVTFAANGAVEIRKH